MNANRNVNQTSLGYKIAVGIFIVIAVAIVSYIIYNTYNTFETSESNSPWLVKDTKLANSTLVIPAYVIKPPNDGKFGTEFSYNFFLYIDNWTYKDGEYKNILVKGDPSGELLQSPGIWLDKNENNILVNMNTFESVRDTVKITGVPLNKWFMLTVVLINNNIDLYVNSNLKIRHKLAGIPKLNYSDVFVNAMGGFSGMMSRVRYFNFALAYYKIQQLFREGPSKKSCTDEADSDENYLAKSWWLTNNYPRTETD